MNEDWWKSAPVATSKDDDWWQSAPTISPPTQAAPAPLVPPAKSGLTRRIVGDSAIDLGKGVIDLGQAAVGLADIPTGGYAGKALESVGYDPQGANDFLSDFYSPERKQANQNVADVHGFLPTVGAMLKNPSTIAGSVLESAPSTVAGGAGVARGIVAKALPLVERAAPALAKFVPMVASGAGEGAIQAGQAAEQTRASNKDKLLTAGQSGDAIASGVIDALITALGGATAQKLGIADIDTLLAGGKTPVNAGKKGVLGVLKRALEGVVQEGVLEELPQSAQEQLWQNYATGQPLMQGVPEAAAQGAITGAVQGGATSAVVGGHGKPETKPESNSTTLQPAPVVAPSPDMLASAPAVQPVAPVETARPMGNPDEAPGILTRVRNKSAELFPDAQPGSLAAVANAAVPAHVDPATGEYTPPTDDALKAQIHASVEDQIASAGKISRTRTRQALPGIVPRRADALIDAVMAERKQGITAANYAETPNVDQPERGSLSAVAASVVPSLGESGAAAAGEDQSGPAVPAAQTSDHGQAAAPAGDLRREANPVADEPAGARAEGLNGVDQSMPDRILRKRLEDEFDGQPNDPAQGTSMSLGEGLSLREDARAFNEEMQRSGDAKAAQAAGEAAAARVDAMARQVEQERRYTGEQAPRPAGTATVTPITKAKGYDLSETQQEADIVPPSGSPYSIRDAADKEAARHEGGKVFPVEGGGFVVRVPGSASQESAAATAAPQRPDAAEEGAAPAPSPQAAPAALAPASVGSPVGAADQAGHQPTTSADGQALANAAPAPAGDQARTGEFVPHHEGMDTRKFLSEAPVGHVATVEGGFGVQGADGAVRWTKQPNGDWSDGKNTVTTAYLTRVTEEGTDHNVLEGQSTRINGQKALPTSGGLNVRMGNQVVPITDMADAQAKYDEFRAIADAGARNLPPVDIVNNAGEVVAHFSYNGRVWKGARGAQGKREEIKIGARAVDALEGQATRVTKQAALVAPAAHPAATGEASPTAPVPAAPTATATPSAATTNGAAPTAGESTPASGAEGASAKGEVSVKSIDERIAEAKASGVVLSAKDEATIRQEHARAQEFTSRAQRAVGRGADPMGKGNAFPMGVGFTKMTKRKSQAIDSSVTRAGEAVRHFGKAEAAQKQVDALLSGKGTEAHTAERATKKQESNDKLMRQLLSGELKTLAGADVVRVNKDRNGTPSSITVAGKDIIKGVNDRLPLAEVFGGQTALNESAKRVQSTTKAETREASGTDQFGRPNLPAPIEITTPNGNTYRINLKYYFVIPVNDSIKDTHRDIVWSVEKKETISGGNASFDSWKRVTDKKIPATIARRAEQEVARLTKEQQAETTSKATAADKVSDQPTSWVLREKATGKVIAETRDPKKVAALNTDKYEAVPVKQHLAELNQPESLAAKAARQESSPAPKEAGKGEPVRPIEDFGERLDGARKFLPPSLKAEISDDDIANQPLSKVWPSDAHLEIEDPMTSAMAFSARKEIPAKPRQPRKVKAWVAQVKMFRGLMRVFTSDSMPEMIARAKDKGFASLVSEFFPKVQLLAQLPRETWSRVEKVGQYPDARRLKTDAELKRDGFISVLREGSTTYYDHFKVDPKTGRRSERIVPWGDTAALHDELFTANPFSAVTIDGKTHTFDVAGIGPDEVQKVKELLGEAAPQKGGLTTRDFEIRSPRSGGSAFINRKGDSAYRHLKDFTGADAVKQARAFLTDANVAELTTAWEQVKARDNVGKGDVRRGENRERVGENRRNGKDVSEGMFEKAFGFRGVQFGNWVGQGKGSKDRQGLLNDAYDALLDLSDVLGIPSQAISLEGSLGLSLGARGAGKHAAHFEPSNLVINLTKTRGAGSLAHEWFHALDNYFARKRGGEVAFKGNQQHYRENNYVTYKPEPMLRSKRGFGEKTKAEVERLHKAHPSASAYNMENWEPSPNHKDGVRPAVEKSFAELVAALNASPMATRAAVIDAVKVRAGVISGDGYWSRIIERGARSFENYVITKMAQRGWTNDFLANIRDWEQWQQTGKAAERYPYLRPDEEGPIVDAFDNLFGTIQPRTLEGGKVALENTEQAQELTKADLTPAEQEVLDRANNASEAKEKAAALSRAQGEADAHARGFHAAIQKVLGDQANRVEYVRDYKGLPEKLRNGVESRNAERNGKVMTAAIYDPVSKRVFLVTSVIKTADRAVWNAAHELAGHDGLRKLLGDKLDPALTIALQNPTVKQLADAIMADRNMDRGQKLLAAEESLAELAAAVRTGNFDHIESRYGVKVGDGIREQQSLKAAIANFLKRLQALLDDLFGRHVFLDEDVRELLDAAYQASQSEGSVAEASALESTAADQTQTPAFRKWFGDSKVVDAEGKPLAVYHGTQSGEFDTFRPGEEGIFFAEKPETARFYADGGDIGSGNGRVMSAYLSLQNPLRMTWREWMKGETDSGINHYLEGNEGLAARGYDGAILTEPLSDDPAADSTTYVAFRPEQIKSATANNGNFDASKPSILENVEPIAKRAKEHSPEVIADIEAVMNAGSDKTLVQQAKDKLAALVPAKVKDQLRPTWLAALSTDMLAELGSDYHANMQHYADFLKAMNADRNELQQQGEEVSEAVRQWGSKHPEQAKDLFKLMHQATSDGVDPAKEYQPLQFRFNGKLHEVNRKNITDAVKVIRQQMRERSGDSKKDLMDEVKKLNAMLKAEPGRKAQYPVLQQKWAALSSEAQAHYVAMRDAYAERSQMIEDGLVQRIEDTDAPDNHKRKLITLIRQQFETQRLQGVYFPLQRFGQYFVSASKGETDTFLMFESLNKLEAGVRSLKQRGFTVNAQGLKSQGKAIDAPSGTFVADVIAKLKAAHISEATQDDIYQMYLQALPELSLRKHAIHRQAVPGFDPDAVRGFAFNMLHGAHQIARLRYAHKLADTITLLKAQQDAKRREPEADTRKVAAGDAILNELQLRHQWIMNPTDSKLTGLVSSFGFLYYLGLTPAAAMVNLTQTALLTFPYLAARHGPVKAMNHLLTGMRDSIRTGGHIQKHLTNPDELRMHAELQRRGVLDKTQAFNLAGIAEGGLAGHNPQWAKAMQIIGLPFHKAEVVNREASSIAAYRLAREDGKSHEQAVDAAARAVNDTHFDYTNQNRARVFQSGTAKTLLMFRQYSLNMTWHMGRMLWQATKNADPEVKTIARRNLAGVLGMSALFSGTMGLPLMSVTFGILNAIAASFGNDDEPWDAETEFRAFLDAMFGKGAGAVIADGGVNALTGADIASRVSLSQLWFRDADRELDGRGAYYNLLEQAAGPMGGVLKNALVGKQMIDEGHTLRGIETMLPKALKDTLKAQRYASEGVNNLRGDPLVQDVSLRDTLLQLSGFTPADVAKQYDVNRSLKNYEQAILDRRGYLLDAFAMAIRTEDPDARQEVLAKIQQFNRTNPEIAITTKGIRNSLASRARYSQDAENGISLNRKLSAKLHARVDGTD